MRTATFLWTVTAALAISGPAGANDAADGAFDPPVYLGIGGSYLLPDRDRGPDVNIRRGAGVQFLYGRQYESRFGFEGQLFGDILETGKNQGTDFYRYGVGLDGFYAFGDRTAFTPFVLLGAGVARNDVFPDDRDDWNIFANAGVGFVTAPFTERGDLKLRGEARYIYDDFESGVQDWKFTLGIEIPLRRKPEVQMVVEERVRVVEVPVEPDPCPAERVTELDGVSFEFDSARLRPDAETILNWTYETLRDCPNIRVEIAGHTCNIGSAEYNHELSHRRAQSVVDYLIDRGIDAGRLSARGYGLTEPVASNNTEEGRERNRRVELRVID